MMRQGSEPVPAKQLPIVHHNLTDDVDVRKIFGSYTTIDLDEGWRSPFSFIVIKRTD